MIRAELLLSELQSRGYDLLAGVPCSYLTPLINSVINAPGLTYVGATNEGDAVSIAAGAELGGRHGLALFQNSGLGNAVNPLTSLTAPFGLPLIVLTTWRGQPDKPADEPQHEVMGRITPRLLELMDIPWQPFPDEEAALGPALDRAEAHIRAHRLPYGFILSQGVVLGDKSPAQPAFGPLPDLSHLPPARSEPAVFHQDEVLATVQRALRPTDAVVATTGFTGRALYGLGDQPNQLYMVGSMGCASSFGLGLALAQPQRRIVVLDGDGAVLMRMGALATLGHERPPNLLHLVLDNGVHDSTGGQATVSPSIDLTAIAGACGYPRLARIHALDDLRDLLQQRVEGLAFVHVRTHPRENRKLPRPTLTPRQVVDRFRHWLQSTR